MSHSHSPIHTHPFTLTRFLRPPQVPARGREQLQDVRFAQQTNLGVPSRHARHLAHTASLPRHRRFNLLNKEFTFTIDTSNLPCGLNGALYFVEMQKDGGVSEYSTNEASNCREPYPDHLRRRSESPSPLYRSLPFLCRRWAAAWRSCSLFGTTTTWGRSGSTRGACRSRDPASHRPASPTCLRWG